MAAVMNQIWKSDLPADIAAALEEFRAKSVEGFGDSLKSLLLFGSAAEGRLRPTSDVNLVMVFSRLDIERVKTWRPQVGLLVAAIDLNPLILLETEIAAAAEAFAVKYFDILHRRRVLHGTDPFATLEISDEALRRRVSQVLLNLALRLRHTMFFGNDAGRTHALVDAIGPLRASAVALQELARQPLSEPREALLALAAKQRASALIEQIQALRTSGDPVVADSTRLLGELIAFIHAIQHTPA
jgi:predicted nucleotidyltransferase